MANVSLESSPQWQWSWVALCGEDFKIWAPQRHDLGLCFQQLCLHIPVLAILAISSAYYYGRQEGFVTRGRIQLIAINIRSVLVLLLAFLPILQISIDLYKSEDNINDISFFLSAVQGISWFAHFIYILGLRKKLGKSPRGPIFMCIIWSLMFALTVISFRSHYLLYQYSFEFNYSVYLAYGFSICYLLVEMGYAATLIPSEGSTTYFNFSNRYTEISESQSLLHNAYVRFTEEGDPTYLGVAMEDANWFSRLLFYWVNPLMTKGFERQLKSSEDLYDLPLSLSCGFISAKLYKQFSFDKEKYNHDGETEHDFPSASTSSTLTSANVAFVEVKKNNTSLLLALHRCFWLQFYSIGILRLIADCSTFAGPMLLNKLVGFIEDKSEDIKWGYIYATGLMSATVLASLCDTHFQFLMGIVGLRMRGALITTIYRKTLSVSSTTLNSKFSIGEIVNFMSTDTDRIVNSCPSFHAVWSIPFQLGVTLYLLYTQVGLAFLAGLVFGIILIPINKLIANKIGQLSTKLMEQKDARVKLISEVLRGIKAIKLYAWEQHFIRLIIRIRDKELKYLKGRKYLDALCVYFWATTPVVISIFTFGTYVLMGNKLTAATVFTGMALLNMLIVPLNAFPWVLNGMTEAWVSMKRIQKLLDLPDLDLDLFYSQKEIEGENTELLMLNGCFDWGKELSTEEKLRLHALNEKKSVKGKGIGKSSYLTEDKRSIERHIEESDSIFKLFHIDFKIKKGEFVGIIGSVGSGKSSFLSAILGELRMHSGAIVFNQIESGFALVTQQPWLQRGTIRDNILFGKPFDESKYKAVLFACDLAEDIHQLPAGDMTGVGESGMTLSGGQKARVALARAVYQDKSVYLLDDILSAVDTKVAKHIFHHCIMGLLLNKTKILCTHHIQYLVHADTIALIENGTFKEIGRPADVLAHIDDTLTVDIELGESQSTSTSATNSLLDSVKQDSELEEKPTDSVMFQEISETGSLDCAVYISYWKAIGHILSLSILTAIVFMQFSRNLTDWWLAHWVTNAGNSSNGTNNTNIKQYLEFEDDSYDMSFYLKIYVELACVNMLFTLLRAFLFAYGGIKAATKFHKLLLKSVVKAKCTFFDITPTGRILNRFSSDTYTVDDSLPFVLNILLAVVFGLIGTLVITVYGLPWICMILIPLIPVYHWLQNHYRLTSRELKRISSVTLSPVYSHFNETLQGLTTIRALRATQRFKRDNEDNVDANIKAQFASQAAGRWLGLRLQFIGVAVVAGVSFIAVIQHQYDIADPGMRCRVVRWVVAGHPPRGCGGISAGNWNFNAALPEKPQCNNGLIGLAISYALSVTGTLSSVVNIFTETEREMIAVERVNQYIKDIPTESTYFASDPPFAWPSQGVISFINVVLNYREHLPPSLKGVSFETRPCEKIGVVGRTGAGKSSLISVLFRLVEVSSGSVYIDSVNINCISISALRSRMFCIPQDPFLFSGTIRENLDPLREYGENDIWSALSKVNLLKTITKMGGLERSVEEGGSNFSAGQKQLICLARAVLRNAKILCIDEATANVDHETDRLIQQTLRSAFRKSTVITIAHRIRTIFDSDRVLVMSDGEVVEFDSPEVLLASPSSQFYQLVNE